MAITPPPLVSKLSMPTMANNFVPLQSAAILPVGTGQQSLTFTNIPSTQRVTFKISNTGSNGVYCATGNSAATAVLSSSTPQPTSGASIVSNCDIIPAGAILTQDYVAGTDTLAFITRAGTTNIEVTIGSGQ